MVNGNVIGMSDYYYEDSENYVAGDTELTGIIENIEINWMSGNVTVLTHSTNTVSISEKSVKELTENTKLHYWLENTTLHIKFLACGKWDLSEYKKDLTILVPEDLVISNLKVSTLSANVKLNDCAVTELVEVNTLSGNINAKFSAALNKFEGESTSGAFTVSAPSVSRFEVEVVSGAVNLSVQKEPAWLDIDTTSGDISLIVPDSASFTLDYDTTSGDISSELSYRKSAKKYIFGDGKGEYKISTVSGDARINAYN